MRPVNRIAHALLRPLLGSHMSVRFPSHTTNKNWKEYKGEEYDPDQKVVPEIQLWKQQYDPELDTSKKSTVSMINDETEGILMVNGYSPAGFSLNNGMKVLGPMILFSKSLFRWKVDSMEELTPDAFSLFYLLDPKIGFVDREKYRIRKEGSLSVRSGPATFRMSRLTSAWLTYPSDILSCRSVKAEGPDLDILVIGYGDKGKQFDHRLLLELTKRRRLGIEVLPTDQAVGTFNWLNGEKRYVAGAFIPPTRVIFSESELHNRTQMLGLSSDDGEVVRFSDPKYKIMNSAKSLLKGS